MPLIKSISGIRGTIGGEPGSGLTPEDIVRFVSAYSKRVTGDRKGPVPMVVVGRDARVSGEMVNHIVCGTLMGCGINVVDLGLATTPTVEMAVRETGGSGGIIITASHNPGNWNALKLLNARGEFLSAEEGMEIARMAEVPVIYEKAGELGKYLQDYDQLRLHIEKILALPLVDREAVRKAGLSVAFDAVNSVGGLAIPPLLEAMGVRDIIPLYDEPTGLFPHNPEPLPENLREITSLVPERRADVGFAVDPDVDRLAIISEDGSYFGEEYTLVAVADYVLMNKPGNTVSNLSSTKALGDITLKYGGKHYASAVGEVNVVEMMRSTGAVIGGEGNGGVIYPDLHLGRDALVGIALFLTHLALSGKPCSELRSGYPEYFMAKKKVDLSGSADIEKLLMILSAKYRDFPQNALDGLYIEIGEGWVHLRSSNTEPVIRVYAEGKTQQEAEDLAGKIMADISNAGC